MKVFIHPEVLLRARYGQEPLSETATSLSVAELKKAAQREINVINAKLFGQSEYGQIGSHFNTERLASTTKLDIREKIITMYYQRTSFASELSAAITAEQQLERKLTKLQRSLFSFLFKKRITTIASQLEEATAKRYDLDKVAMESYVGIEYDFGLTSLQADYSDLLSAFTTLKSASKIWDITARERNFETKSSASSSVTRNLVIFDFAGLDLIQTAQKVMHLQNYNGGDFYFYPSFVVYYKTVEELAIIDYKELFIQYQGSRFLESEAIPPDAEVIGETWDRVNKDGSPDRRFANNFKRPVVHYGQVHLKTTSGINDAFQVSDHKKAAHFVEQFNKYKLQVVATVYDQTLQDLEHVESILNE